MIGDTISEQEKEKIKEAYQNCKKFITPITEEF